MAEAIPDFGLPWEKTFPGVTVPLLNRHQYCAYHGVGNMGTFYHRKERIKAIWPSYQWHRWSERRLKAMCDSRWVTWLGPAASGKSSDAAIFALEFWLQAPDRTAVVVCSTTMKMLRSRIWTYITRYHQMIAKSMGFVGDLLDSVTRIRWKNGDDMTGIFGMAVEEGSIEEVKHNLIGLHPERYLLLLDEAQGVRQAIVSPDVTGNMAKNPWFGALLMGNPDDMSNPLLRESEPIGGWGSVTMAETEQWETLGGPTKGSGIAQFFDGRKSPADDSPEERKRLSFLINKEWIANHLKGVRGNANDPSFWSQCIGWPPPMGLESTVLDDSIILKFRCRERAIWTEGFFKWASFDASFEGKDKKVLTFGRCGETSSEESPRRWQIGIDEQIEVPINADDKDTPIHYQILNFVRPQCEKRGIRPPHFGLDSSGEGGGLAAIFKKEWGAVVEVEFGGKPSDKPVDSLGKEAKDAYNSRSSELNFLVREFALGNGLRGLPDEAAKQFCARRTFFRNGKWCVEPKTAARGLEKGFKQRLGYSPDHGDSVAIGTEVCREHGAVPSIEGVGIQAEEKEWTELAIAGNSDYAEDNYLRPDSWAEY